MSFLNFFKRKIIADCGHKTLKVDTVKSLGSKRKTRLPIKNGKTAYCHRCIEKMAIQCAWCGKIIFIGDPVALYSPIDKNREMPDYAVLHNKEHNFYVGCLRCNCPKSGIDGVGFWYPPGVVVCVPNPIELALQAGDPILISDTGDINEATKIP